MNCNYCEEKISDRANFCPKCKNQVKCLECFEVLEKDVDICIICGKEKKSEKISYNTIEFNDLEDAVNDAFQSYKDEYGDKVFLGTTCNISAVGAIVDVSLDIVFQKQFTQEDYNVQFIHPAHTPTDYRNPLDSGTIYEYGNANNIWSEHLNVDISMIDV